MLCLTIIVGFLVSAFFYDYSAYSYITQRGAHVRSYLVPRRSTSMNIPYEDSFDSFLPVSIFYLLWFIDR